MKENNKKSDKKPVKTYKKSTQTVPVQEKIEEKPLKKPLGIAPYIVIGVSIFVLITYFLPDTGAIGPFVRDIMRGLFGIGSYFAPLYALFLAVFRKRDVKNGVAKAKIVFAVGSFLFILVIIHLIDPAAEALQGQSYVSYIYERGKVLNDSGVIGATVGSVFESLIGTVATAILSSIMAFVLLVLLFGSTPSRVLRSVLAFFKEFFNASKSGFDEEKQQPESPKEEKKKNRTEDTPPKKTPILGGIPEDVAGVGSHDVEDDDVPYQNLEINRERPYDDESGQDKYKRIFEETTEEKLPQITEKYHEVAEAEFGGAKNDESLFLVSEDGVQTEMNTDDMNADESDGDVFESETESVDMSETDEQPYVFPPVSLLHESTEEGGIDDYDAILETGKRLISVLDSYGVRAKLVSTSRGPTVTRYEVLPDVGVRVNKVANLSDDIRMRMAATSIRIETNIPGKAAIGIEIPNKNAGTVHLRSLIDQPRFRDNKSKLFVCLGVDVAGNPVYFDIPDMPHLLVAGATGMGKSVCINSIIMSILYRAKPDEVKLIMIDPKKIELAPYKDIPHLSVPIVTDPRKAAGSLNWAVVEMEKRYTLMQEVGDSRNIEEYNSMIEGDPEREKLPYIVIIIDEFADLIMSSPDEVETSICRLAQKARAAGIYLIIGTQRPTVNVITGLIKANVPSRIAFTVQSQIDSRTIIDTAGAEKLCGRGDMLFAPVKALKPIRVQGTFVDRTEVAAVCSFVRNIAKATYNEEVIKQIEAEAKLCGLKPSQRAKEEAAAGGVDEKEDPLFMDAIGVAFEFETMSTSLLQRRLSVGYSRAQKMIDMMEARGYVGKFDTQTKKRKILITLEEYQQLRMNKESEDE